MSSRKLLATLSSVLIAAIISGPLWAKTNSNDVDTLETHLSGDSTRPYELPAITVRSDLHQMSEVSIPHQVTIVDQLDVKRSGSATLSELTSSAGGFRSDLTGNVWGGGQVDVRGFYGGGQVDHVKVLIDGIAVNSELSGRVNWSLINPLAIDRLESFAGPVSDQQGDYGMGGLVALYTNEHPEDNMAGSLHMEVGSSSGLGLTGEWSLPVSQAGLYGWFSARTNDGWRNHSNFDARVVSGHTELNVGSLGRLEFGVTVGHTSEERPGALSSAELAQDRTKARIGLDGREWPDKIENTLLLSVVSLQTKLSEMTSLASTLHMRYDESDEVITITSPMYHTPRLIEFGVENIIRHSTTLFGKDLHSVIGANLEYGSIETRYDVWSGAGGDRPVIWEGKGHRTAISGFGTTRLTLSQYSMLVLGARMDHITADFEFADPGLAILPVRPSSPSTAVVSPRVSLVAYPLKSLTCYVSFARAFKSPTLSHLYDAPPVFFFQPPDISGYLSIANDELRALRGIQYEVGSRINIGQSILSEICAYQFNVENEIDFDPALMRYDNVGRSRHVGLRLQAELTPKTFCQFGSSIEYTKSEIRSGNDIGNQQDGVPELRYSFFGSTEITSSGFVRLSVTGQAREYLNSDNTMQLSDYATARLGIGYEILGVSVGAFIDNVLDETYESAGYVDIDGTPRYYPAPGRTLYVSVSRGF